MGAFVHSVSGRFKNERARVEKMPLNIRTGTDCVSECVLKTLACRGFAVSALLRTWLLALKARFFLSSVW